jgi:hypothetical protein
MRNDFTQIQDLRNKILMDQHFLREVMAGVSAPPKGGKSTNIGAFLNVYYSSSSQISGKNSGFFPIKKSSSVNS